MKKIIALFVFIFTFSINASAQDNKIEIETNAKKDLETLMNVVKIDNDMQMPFLKLFKKKHEGMSAPHATEETKRKISSSIEAKLRATLKGEQISALEKSNVFSQLIGLPMTTTAKTAKK